MSFFISLRLSLLDSLLPLNCSISSCSCFPFQVLELVRNPHMIEEVMHNEDGALEHVQPEQDPESVTDGFQKTDTKRFELSQVQVWKWCFSWTTMICSDNVKLICCLWCLFFVSDPDRSVPSGHCLICHSTANWRRWRADSTCLQSLHRSSQRTDRLAWSWSKPSEHSDCRHGNTNPSQFNHTKRWKMKSMPISRLQRIVA